MAQPPHPPQRLRQAAVWLHRWVGLAITGFLLVAGLTGSLIAFNDELEAWISPQLFRVKPPTANATRLDPFVLRERVQQQYPGTSVQWVELQAPERPEQTVLFGLEPAPGHAAPLPNDEVFVNPYTGSVVGARLRGDIRQGWTNLMPFIYRLHDSLALGSLGSYALGSAALLWTVDCFVGLYLTLPLPSSRKPATRKPWAARWSPAWKLRWRGGAFKVTFDLHRAGGLWVWAMLLVLAWSSVGFNLREVYQPVMESLLGRMEPSTPAAPLAAPLVNPPIGWREARVLAAQAMAEQARTHGFTLRRERLIHYDPARGIYGYRTLSSLDVGSKLGNTTLYLDGRTGRVLQVELPTGSSAGGTVTTWIMALHTAAIGGLAMQVFLCAMGGMVVLLSATGLLLWWRKRRARHAQRLHMN